MSRKFNVSIIILISIFAFYLRDYLLDFNEIIYNTYKDNYEIYRLQYIIEKYNQMHIYSYFITPIITLFKIFIVSLILYIGALCNKIEVSYSTSFDIALNSEYFLLSGTLASILYYWITNSYLNLESVSINPFSFFSLFKIDEVEPWLRYPFSLLNIFEVFYWVALIVQWKKLTGKTYGESFDFIGSTYGLGLLLWVLVVIFFTI